MSEAIHLLPGAVDGAIAALRSLLGEDRVVTDRAELEFHSQDVYRAGLLPAAIIRPRDTDELSRALRLIANAQLPIVPRGGGMSYTDGYLPSRPDSIMVDLLAMSRARPANPIPTALPLRPSRGFGPSEIDATILCRSLLK
ncbi:MAG: FAD-binding protein, partial [Proteobacteria bacterium]|nr:FAD-binding protein [Pseudomonadota bacterium]